MTKFGDISGDVKPDSGPETDEFDMLVALAARYEVDPTDLLERLSGSDVLAKICRDILGLPGVQKRRGRSPDEDTNWRLFRFVVEYRLQHGTGLNEAIREWVVANGGDNENGSAESTWLKRYKRQAKRWSGIGTLQMLYMERPPEGT